MTHIDAAAPHAEETESGESRRTLLAKTGALLAAGSALALPDIASAGTRRRTSIASALATFEAFGVTLLTEAVRRAPGTPSATFAGVLAAANTTEFHHLQALRRIGGRPLATRFWIPNAILDGGAGLFGAIANQEEIEISAYLVGVTEATREGDPRDARLYAEALGTEAEHRVLARFARAAILGRGNAEAPNNRGFEAFPHRSAAAALRATARAGIGFGEQGTAAGAFYEYPGDPRENGTGAAVLSPRPS
jgi:hypothetical protein